MKYIVEIETQATLSQTIEVEAATTEEATGSAIQIVKNLASYPIRQIDVLSVKEAQRASIGYIKGIL